jgi:hypothetical protein
MGPKYAREVKYPKCRVQQGEAIGEVTREGLRAE